MGKTFTWAIVGAAVFIGACGDESAPPPPPPPPSDSGSDASDAGMDGDMDAAMDAMDAADSTPPMGCADDPLAPTVEITAPVPAADPNTDEILTESALTVVCAATQSTAAGSRPVDSTTVAIDVLGPDGSIISMPMVELGAPGTYEAMVDLSMVPNGPVSFTCRANDTSTPPRCDTTTVTTFIDHGPTITVLTPMVDAIVSSRLELRYRLAAAPLDATDMEADVAGHELIVAGRTITGMVEDPPGEFLADIDLEDRTIFPDPLDGPRSFTIRAWNERTPDPVERVLDQAFVVDAVGPTIMITTPMDADLVGGVTSVEAEITDAGGVDPASVELRVGGMTLPMTGSGTTYTRSFDASGFARTITELTLNVSASDMAGNTSVASVPVKLDSTPPYISLDPPMIRDGAVVMGTLRCSEAYDPVGSDSVNDGEIVGTAAEFRVRTEDLPNSAFGGTGTAAFLAGLDTTTVDLYILDNTSVPLLVDTDGDGTCDDVNPAVRPGAAGPDTAVVIELSPITSRGLAYYDPSLDFTSAPAPYSSCNPGSATSRPAPLCGSTSPLTRVIPASTGGPAIFAKPPITATTCVGDAWDFQTNISEGWACVAARAEDLLGNVGVSVPLRACFLDGAAPEPCPGSLGDVADASVRPACTDGCTPPPSFDSITALQLSCPTCP